MMSPESNRPTKRRWALVSVALSAAVAVGLVFGPFTLQQQTVNAQGNDDTYRQLSLFGDVFERVRDSYVERVSDEALIEAAINGMLSSLDPHSGFLNKKNFRDMQVQTRGEFGGLGIEVSMENGYVKVVSPIDETPAARAGLLPGDLITHLDGKAVLGLTLNQAVELMRGKVGTSITLSIRRANTEAFDVSITRANITIRSIRARMVDDIAYIRVTTFNENTTTGLHRSIREAFEEKGDSLIGFVLDLRNNPGGLLKEAITVSDTFLEKGEIVSTRGRDPNDSTRENAKPGDMARGLPIVVIINGGSASASEIVAGALQDHRRAIIVGQQSFGKGSVQTIIPLNSDVAMRLTTARYYTPSGRSIQQTGIAPDIDIPVAKLETVDTGRVRRESDLRGALTNDTDNGANKADEDDTPEDYQLARALDLLRGIHLFESRIAN